jgi:hypothetical protein
MVRMSTIPLPLLPRSSWRRPCGTRSDGTVHRLCIQPVEFTGHCNLQGQVRDRIQDHLNMQTESQAYRPRNMFVDHILASDNLSTQNDVAIIV